MKNVWKDGFETMMKLEMDEYDEDSYFRCYGLAGLSPIVSSQHPVPGCRLASHKFGQVSQAICVGRNCLTICVAFRGFISLQLKYQGTKKNFHASSAHRYTYVQGLFQVTKIFIPSDN